MIPVARVVDTLLDRTIVGGYTSVGYQVRRRAWEAGELERLEGRTVVISGATSGIGLAAAHAFARLGARVRILARSQERGEQARGAISAGSASQAVDVITCDLSSLRSVRSCAELLVSEGGRIDVLVNNAGVLPERRELSADGIELTFATNVLGPFLLTNKLVPLMRAAPGDARAGVEAAGGVRRARIIYVSSGGMYSARLDVEDLQMERREFDGVRAYAQTKREQVVLTELWAQRLDREGIVVHAMHPGWVDTPGVRSSLPRFYRLTKPLLRTPEQGADTIVWLGASAEAESSSGGFWHDRRRRPTHTLPWTCETPDERERLWSECERLSAS